MSDKVFLDTDILVYAIESAGPEPAKAATALSLARQPLVRITIQWMECFDNGELCDLDELCKNAPHLLSAVREPGNVLVASDGTVKVLDLGVAKLYANHNLDRIASAAEVCHILGTLQYIAPEQTKSRDVDARTAVAGHGQRAQASSLGAKTSGEAPKHSARRRIWQWPTGCAPMDTCLSTIVAV